MKHLVFFIHILSFICGCVTVALSFVAYIRYKSRLVKYYIYFLISFTAVISERTVAFYKRASVFQGEYLDVVFWVISCLGSGLLMYSLPLFIHDLLQLDLPEKKKTVFGLMAYLPIISLVLYYTLPYKITVLTIISSIVFLNLLYCACLTAVHLNNVKEPEMRALIKTFLIILGIWIPFLIVDSKVEQVALLQRMFPYGLMSIPLFYLVWNSLSLYFGQKYFRSFIDSLGFGQTQPLGGKPEDIPAAVDFFDKYKITSREREVILLLAKGYSYNRISQELMISLTTTRTHIYNVYQKVDVKNKIELINLMKSNSAV